MNSESGCFGQWPFPAQNVQPCGPTNSTTPYVQCCASGDYCLSDGICFYTHSLYGGTGYYTAYCTDQTFNAPTCRKRCFDNPEPDIVYNSNTNTWDCCSFSGGVRNCANPSNETFEAPAPSNLQTLVLLPSTGTLSYTSAPTTTSSSTSGSSLTTSSSTSVSSLTTSTSQHSSSNSSSSSGISAGASAGIGVGVTLGVVLVAAGIGVLVYRRKRKRRNPRLSDQPSYGASPFSQHLKGSGNQSYTLNPRAGPHELSG